MELENDAKLKEVARRQHSVGMKIKSLQKNPQITSQQNAPLLSQLKIGLKDVIMKTKNYPQWAPPKNPSTKTRKKQIITKQLKPKTLETSNEPKIENNQEKIEEEKQEDNTPTIKELMIELKLEDCIELLEESEIDMELLEKCSKEDLLELGLAECLFFFSSNEISNMFYNSCCNENKSIF